MRWLVEPGPDVRVPPGFAGQPVAEPSTTRASAAQVEVTENGEPLITIPAEIATRIVYEELPLPTRGAPLLRAGLVERLHRAARGLPAPFGLVVLDGWRSPDYQRALLDHYRRTVPGLEDGWVSEVDAGPVAPHTTGGAVDLTLSWHGQPLALGTDFDAFEDAARPAALEAAMVGDPAAVLARDLRRMLTHVLAAQDMAVYPMEWWHWSYGDQWWAAAGGRSSCPYGAVTERR